MNYPTLRGSVPRSIFTFVLLAALPGAVGCVAAPTEPDGDQRASAVYVPVPQNILLIIADDLGVDRVNVYAQEDYPGYASANAAYIPQTPTIDSLAMAGVRFTQAWSMPVCSPTRSTVYSGRYPFRTGVGAVVSPGSSYYLSLDETTVAEVLDLGSSVPPPGSYDYDSGIFGKWHVGAAGNGALTDDAPRDQGWDTHQGTMSGTLPDYYSYEKWEDGASVGTVTQYATRNTVDDAIDWIAAQSGRWMATVALNAPHTSGSGAGNDYEVPPSACGYGGGGSGTKEGRFIRTVECLDYQLDRLLTNIDPGALEHTTILFMGDNGSDTDNAGSHGVFADGRGKGTLYESGIRVPFIVADGFAWVNLACRATIEENGQILGCDREVDSIVSVADVYATALEIAGRSNTTGVDSVSLVPYLESLTPSAQRTSVYSEQFDASENKAVIRGSQYKLHVNALDRPDDPCDGYTDPSWEDCCVSGSTICEFYKLSADRWESSDLLTGALTAGQQNACKSLLATMAALHQSWVDEECP